MDNQLIKGLKVEREHKKTYLWLLGYIKTTGKFPSEKDFYLSIAKDHIAEDRLYYDKLEKIHDH